MTAGRNPTTDATPRPATNTVRSGRTTAAVARPDRSHRANAEPGSAGMSTAPQELLSAR